MNTDQFLEVVRKDVEESGGSLHLPMERSVDLGDGVMCNGYWDEETKVLAAARAQSEPKFLRLLVHEYGHFRQWKEKRKAYWISYTHPLTEILDRTLEDIFFSWLNGEECNKELVKFTCDVARDLELDCERVTIKLIKKYKLPIDIDEYCQRAAAYTYFYNTLPETRKWYVIGREPYNNPDILKLMPKNLDGDFTKTPPKVSAMMRNCIKPKLVYLESPFAGEVTRNIKYARACMADSLRRGESPIASHLLYTQDGILDDTIPEERKRGMEAGFNFAEKCEASVFYTDLGMSSGMIDGIHRAKDCGREIEFRTLPNWGKAE